MRLSPCSALFLGLCIFIGPAAAFATACGGSTASSPHDADSGAVDASNVDAGVSTRDSGVVVDSGVVDDDGACPVVSGSGSQATHGNPPVVSNLGGPVLRSPTVVTFTFQDTANAAALQAFGATIGSTPWFAEVLHDYTTTTSTPVGLSVAIAANADATYVDNGGVGLDGGAGAGSGTDLNAFMNQAIANAVTAKTIPAPDGNTVYMFYFPSTTTITGFVGPSCQAYGGYHFNQVYADGKTPIYYAILPDCAAGSPYELEAVTVDASHELAEAVSDPAPNTGWSLDTSPYPDAGTTPIEFRNDPWLSLGYGEIADNCAENAPLMLDGGTVVQRIWSNSAATGGHDPCVPAPAGETYFNASPDKAIYVANVGDTITVDVTPFSDVARSSWQLDAVDYSQELAANTGGSSAAYLKFEWVGGVVRSDGVSSLTCVNSGTQAHLQVTLLAEPVLGQTSEGAQIWAQAVGAIYSVDLSQQTATEPGQNTALFVWPFEVITPAAAAQIGVGSSGIADMARRRRFWEPVRRGR
ncbi:MAG TPA: hypothetical protein VGL81_23810 [Polyangiaceae bacterium]|jgi:hypothetical protein